MRGSIHMQASALKWLEQRHVRNTHVEQQGGREPLPPHPIIHSEHSLAKVYSLLNYTEKDFVDSSGWQLQSAFTGSCPILLNGVLLIPLFMLKFILWLAWIWVPCLPPSFLKTSVGSDLQKQMAPPLFLFENIWCLSMAFGNSLHCLYSFRVAFSDTANAQC